MVINCNIYDYITVNNPLQLENIFDLYVMEFVQHILTGGIIMKSMCLRKSGVLALAVVALALSGCLFSPDEDMDRKPVVSYKPLTDKENVIYNLVRSYKQANIDEYVKILHDDFVWFNQARDIVSLGLPEYNTRAEDSAMTARMFQAKLGTHPDPNRRIRELELELHGTVWQSVTELEGVPCEDCWETTREYYLTIRMYNGNILTGNNLVKLTVVSVMEDDQKLYKLRRADDIEKN